MNFSKSELKLLNEGSNMSEAKRLDTTFTQPGFLWKRTIASIADWLILLLPALLIGFAFQFAVSGGNVHELQDLIATESTGLELLRMAILTLFFSAYFTYFIGKTGQTPGKKIMGLKVVNEKGGVVGCKIALMRYIFFIPYQLGSLGFIILIISAISGSADKNKRMLHDRLSKTFVIGKEKEDAIDNVVQEGKERISGAAVFSLILSVFCIIIPVVGQIICFYVCGRAIYDINQSDGLLKGKYLAIAGMIISAAFLIAFLILFFFIIPQGQ